MSEIQAGLCQCGCGATTPIAKQNHTKKGYVKGQPLQFVRGHQHIGRPSPLRIETQPNTTVFCACGCGELTPVAMKTHRNLGIRKGDPFRFIQAHVGRVQPSGESAHRWQGGRIAHKSGYVMLHQPDHHRSTTTGYVMEHILIAEKALGRPLPRKHPVHHSNERKDDNRNANLVICESHSYHRLLHRRMRARKLTSEVRA